MPNWKPFPLMELPLAAWQREHVEGCMVCRGQWRLSAFAYHEATHAAVALKLGLEVEFTAIDQDREITVTKLEAQLYPLIREGMRIPAIATRLDPRDLQRQPEKVMVAMVAPSCVHTGNRHVDDYAGIESFIAVGLMEARGIDRDKVLDEALSVVDEPEVQDRVLQLARQLAESGWVDLKQERGP